MIKEVKFDGNTIDGVLVESVDSVAGGMQKVYTDHMIGSYTEALRSVYRYALNLVLHLKFYATDTKTHREVRNDFIKLINLSDIHEISFVLDNNTEIKANAVFFQLKGGYSASDKNLSEASMRVRLLEPLHTDYTSVDITPQAYGGIPIPTPVPASWQNLSSGGITITNNGNVPYFAKLKIYGEINQPAVFNLTKGESFYIDKYLNDGHYIDVYFYNGLHVIYDDNDDWEEYTRNPLIKIYPGDNEIAFAGISFNSNAKLTLSYAHFYNGV